VTDLAIAPTRTERYGNLILRYRWFVIPVAIGIVLLMAAGGQSLKITNDSRVFFSDDNPQLLALEALERTFTESNNVLIAIAPKDGNVFTREALGVIEQVTERGWQVPHSNRVDSITNYTHTWAEGDELIVEDLVSDASSLTEADVARVREIATTEVTLANRFVSTKGHVAAVVVNILMPEDSDLAVTEIMADIEGFIGETRVNHPELDIYLTGTVVTSKAFGDASLDDIFQLGPIIIGVIVVVMALLLRSISGTVGALTVVIFSALTAMGFAGWAGMVLSPGSAGAPTIIMTVAVAHSVHIVSTMFQAMRRGMNKHDAIVESLRINMHPVFLTTVTTAIGFLSMNFSDAPPFHDLGNLVAIGVFSAFIFSTTMLPAFLSFMPIRVRPAPVGRSPFFERFGDFVVRRRRPLLIVMIIVVAGLASGIPQVQLDDNWVRYFDDRYKFRTDSDYIAANLTGLDGFEYTLRTGEEGGITDPVYLQKIDAFADWYREQPKIAHVWSFADVMKRLNMNMHGDDPAFERLPEDRELAAQYLLLYEMSLPFGRDLNDQIDIGKTSTRMIVSGREMSAAEQRATDEKAVAWLEANAPEMAEEASGLSMMFAHISERNIQGMLQGTIIAMALISVLLMFALKSGVIGAISLIPNFIPAAMGFGLWGYMIGQVGVAAAVVTAVTFGIVVDDTIHFLSKYLRARRERGLDQADAVRFAFTTVGHALWTTTAVLAAGFIVLATSGFEVNWSLGLLTAITIALALVADFLLLPPLIMLLDRRQNR
jgi:predicted RND superfamily exporter protein